MSRSTFIIVRMISSLGTTLTLASIPLVLIEVKAYTALPLIAFAIGLGRIIAANWVMPKISHLPPRAILLGTAAIGGAVLATACLCSWLFQNEFIASAGIVLPLIAGFTSTISTVEDSVSHSLLGSLSKGASWVHADSTLFTLCRIIAPGIAAMLIVASQSNAAIVFLFDAVSYFVGLMAYFIFLPVDDRTQTPHGPKAFSVIATLKTHPQLWMSLGLASFGVAAYNAGIVMSLHSLGFDVQAIASFSIAQNAAMVGAGVIMIRFPAWNNRQIFGRGFATVGMIIMGVATTFVLITLGTALLSLGMAIILNGLRASIASSSVSDSIKRMRLGTLASVNSGVGLLGAAMWPFFLKLQFGHTWADHWDVALIAGALFLVLSGVAYWRYQQGR